MKICPIPGPLVHTVTLAEWLQQVSCMYREHFFFALEDCLVRVCTGSDLCGSGNVPQSRAAYLTSTSGLL